VLILAEFYNTNNYRKNKKNRSTPFLLLPSTSGAPQKVWMGFAAKVMDAAKYPLATGLFGAIGVVMIAKYFRRLIHDLKV
jgi:hypothetical protein